MAQVLARAELSGPVESWRRRGCDLSPALTALRQLAAGAGEAGGEGCSSRAPLPEEEGEGYSRRALATCAGALLAELKGRGLESPPLEEAEGESRGRGPKVGTLCNDEPSGNESEHYNRDIGTQYKSIALFFAFFLDTLCGNDSP
eukprot:305792-Prorocentrum_minimum.AAC.1